MRTTNTSGDWILSLTIVVLVLRTALTFVAAAIATFRDNPRTRILWVVCIASFLLLGMVCAIPASQA
jgi:hypothetical protein